jgi:hypothetical protein
MSSITGYNAATVSTLASGTYRHVALSISGTVHSLYLDGSMVAQNIAAGNLFASYTSVIPNVYIGCAGDLSYGLTGSIDDFKIWNRALPATDISAIYWANYVLPIKYITVPTTGLINYYKFNEAAGATQIIDSVSASNSTKFLTNSSTNITFGTTGKINNCVFFNNSSANTSGIVIPNINFPNSSNNATGSILFWIYPLGFVTPSTINNNIYALNIQGGIYAYIGLNSSNSIIYNGTAIVSTPLTLNTWSHVALTFSPGSLVLYINGNLDRSNTSNFGLAASYFTCIGNIHDNVTAFTGSIYAKLDDMSFWNIQLSASQVLGYYNQQK